MEYCYRCLAYLFKTFSRIMELFYRCVKINDYLLVSDAIQVDASKRRKV